MKKLKLELDDLAVESFEPVDRRDRAGSGTVRARESDGESADSNCPDCITYLSLGFGCTVEISCYQTHCAETNVWECTDLGFCSVENCQSNGEC